VTPRRAPWSGTYNRVVRSHLRHYGIPAAEPLPDATRLGPIRLQVNNLDRAAEYYTGVLGLRVIDDSDARVTLGAAGPTATLIELHQRPGARPVPRSGLMGLYHFAILLPTRADLGRFVAHLARDGERFASADHRVSEAIYLWDPDGLGIEVYADRPRDQWQTRERELVMATDPLDLRDLVAAGEDAAWSGMPAGTAMGHMHLNIGDLDAGRRFYHTALGLDVTAWRYPGALFLAAGGYHHHLGTNTWAGRARPAGDDDARLLSWALVLPTADAVDRVRHRLAQAGHATVPDGDAVRVVDPFGTTLRLTVE
jgi:catechol 2,3-dioxygenase